MTDKIEKSEENPNSISVRLTKNEALVFYEFVSRLSKSDSLDFLYEDQAEKRALWNFECLLEKQLIDPLLSNYQDQLKVARDELRDPPPEEMLNWDDE